MRDGQHHGSNGADTLIGTLNNDFITALAGNDLVRWADSADRIYGGYGNDVLLGDRGADSVYGGHGSDRMIWNNGDGSDLMEGGADYDVVQVNGAAAGDAFTIAANGGRVDFDRTNLIPFSLDIGSSERLEVNGGGGADTITGGAGLAGLIRLRLDGGAGDDRLTGGTGNDVLTGGSDADVFVFNDGSDTITDFDDGVDTIRIVVNGIDNFADLTGLMSDVGPDAVIDFGNGDRLELQGVSIVDLDAGDFVFG